MDEGITGIAGVRFAGLKSERLKVPSLRWDLSNTGICGSIPRSWTSQAKFSAEP
jgi:hypothetical protein